MKEIVIALLAPIMVVIITNLGIYLFESRQFRKYKKVVENEYIKNINIEELKNIYNGSDLSNSKKMLEKIGDNVHRLKYIKEEELVHTKTRFYSLKYERIVSAGLSYNKLIKDILEEYPFRDASDYGHADIKEAECRYNNAKELLEKYNSNIDDYLKLKKDRLFN